MTPRALVALVTISLTLPVMAHAAPTTVGGTPFTLVATTSSGPVLFGLASDASGRIYIGNNTNEAIGIPLQLFDPALFVGTAIALQNFGPPVGDADGLASRGDSILVADTGEGIRQIAVADSTTSIYLAGVGTNPTGSPFIFRPSDRHLFVGLGGLTGIDRIDEYDDAGTFVASHTTGTDVETMTYDPAAGLIYYAAFGPEVRSLDPATDIDVSVGMSSGTIDGGLAFDALSGLLFVGTANGVNAGLVETIDPSTGVAALFATGFNGSLGILREPVSGDLYFLEASQLYRLPTGAITVCPTGAQSCRVAGRSSLSIKKGKTSSKDQLVWTWTKGQSTTPAEFGDPINSNGYALCLYVGGTSAPLGSVAVPPDAVKWRALSGKGYQYTDKGGVSAGVRRLVLKGSDANKSKVLVQGKGERLPDPTLGSLPLPITARLVGAPADLCFEAVYDANDVTANDAKKFKATSKTTGNPKRLHSVLR